MHSAYLNKVSQVAVGSHLQLKQEALGSIPSGYLGLFFFQLAYINNDDGMKGLWNSNTLLAACYQIRAVYGPGMITMQLEVIYSFFRNE